jgi:hypothetical protein
MALFHANIHALDSVANRELTMKTLEPHQTLPWLKQISARALRTARAEERRHRFRNTLELIRRLSRR